MSRVHPSKTGILLSWIIALVVMTGAPAHAGELDDAKRAGHIGERFDGYLGAVSNDAPASARSLIKDINAKRKTKYEEVAAKRGVPASEVAKVMGKKLIARAKPGDPVMLESGGWTKK